MRVLLGCVGTILGSDSPHLGDPSNNRFRFPPYNHGCWWLISPEWTFIVVLARPTFKPSYCKWCSCTQEPTMSGNASNDPVRMGCCRWLKRGIWRNGIATQGTMISMICYTLITDFTGQHIPISPCWLLWEVHIPAQPHRHDFHGFLPELGCGWIESPNMFTYCDPIKTNKIVQCPTLSWQ